MRSRLPLPLLLSVLACAGCNTVTEEQMIQQAQVRALPITGGFTFKLYLTPRLGDPEVFGTEGVFYIAPIPFTDADYAAIKQNKYAKNAMFSDLQVENDIDNHVADVCFASSPHDPGKFGEYGRINRLKISSAFTTVLEADKEHFKVEGLQPMVLTTKNGAISANATDIAHAYGLYDARLVVTADASVNLASCLAYAEQHAPADGS